MGGVTRVTLFGAISNFFPFIKARNRIITWKRRNFVISATRYSPENGT